MASRLKTLLSKTYLIHKLQPRFIMTTATRLDEAVQKLKENPYFDKYAEKISQMQKKSPEEFLQRVGEQEKSKQKPKFGTVDTRQYSSVLNPKEELKENVQVEDKKLEAIFKVDLVRDKDPEEIKLIWDGYHINKTVIAASIPKESYDKIKEMMVQYPTFLFPLPRSQGYEFIMAQILGNTVHFTPLLAFQVHKENAPECLTMVHYTELSDKGLVLMRGEYDKNVIDGKEAQCLANQFKMYYSGEDKRKTELLKMFTLKPDEFKHNDLIAELENLTLS